MHPIDAYAGSISVILAIVLVSTVAWAFVQAYRDEQNIRRDREFHRALAALDRARRGGGRET